MALQNSCLNLSVDNQFNLLFQVCLWLYQLLRKYINSVFQPNWSIQSLSIRHISKTTLLSMLSPGLPLLLCLLHSPICSFLLKVPPPPGRFPAPTDSFVPYTPIFRSHVLPWTISYSFMLRVPSPHLNCTHILVSSVDSSALECSVCVHWFYFPWPLFLLEWQMFQWLFLDNKPFTFPWVDWAQMGSYH